MLNVLSCLPWEAKGESEGGESGETRGGCGGRGISSSSCYCCCGGGRTEGGCGRGRSCCGCCSCWPRPGSPTPTPSTSSPICATSWVNHSLLLLPSRPLPPHNDIPIPIFVSNGGIPFCLMVSYLGAGVPNTLNVLTTFPFLLVGVPGLVLCLSGCCFGIRFDHPRVLVLSLSYFNDVKTKKEMVLIGSLRGEMWGWAFFYAATATAAFGSAYYHLRPDDDRVVWDKLPVFPSPSLFFSSLSFLLVLYCFD